VRGPPRLAPCPRRTWPPPAHSPACLATSHETHRHMRHTLA
jgi:hypothetical protein